MTYNKYRAIKTIVDGIKFASKREAKRYQDLCLLEKVGEISKLKFQVPYKISIYDELICKYIADFTYTEDGFNIVEDCKGVRTPVYRLKKKLMKIILGIEIYET